MDYVEVFRLIAALAKTVPQAVDTIHQIVDHFTNHPEPAVASLAKATCKEIQSAG